MSQSKSLSRTLKNGRRSKNKTAGRGPTSTVWSGI